MDFPKWFYRQQTGEAVLMPSEEFFNSLKDKKFWQAEPWRFEDHKNDKAQEIEKLKELIRTLEAELAEKDKLIRLLNAKADVQKIKRG